MSDQFHTQLTITKTALHEHLETWIEAFLIDRKSQNLTPKTIQFYKERLTRLVEYCETQAITQVGQLTPDVLRRFLLWLETRGNNPGGQHACYRAVRAFLLWYWQETDQPGNPPTAKVKAPRVSIEPLKPIELEQVERLLKTCDKSITGMRDRAIFLALLDTGMRAGELLELDLDDIDLTTGATTIRHSKSRKPRTVYFSQPSRRALRAYLKMRSDDNAALWVTEPGTRLGYWGLRTLLCRRSIMAGVEGVSLHSFRRAFALTMLRGGVDIFSLQSLMGHADLQVLRRYLAQTNDDLRQAHAMGSPVDRLRNSTCKK